jgi:hypothetical protein
VTWLPNNEVGISDLLDYKECPRRFAFKMRRHRALPPHLATHEGQRDEPPEATNENNAYGSAIHRAIELTEQFYTDEQAVQIAFTEYQHWLDPEDLQLLKDDIAAYHERDYVGVRTVASEQDMRVPLFVHNGEQIYFRFKIDRLYQRLDNPAVFIMVDYKSSKWRKTAEEVHSDLQQWTYNFGAFEMFPEMEYLTQIYDQLRFGPLPTSKSPQQREQIRQWLIAEITAMLEDDLMEPTHNDWCPWCPVMMSCPVVERLSDWAIAVIQALAPEKKVGRKKVIELDVDHFETYLELYPKAEAASKVLERFTKEVKETVKRAPSDRREDWDVKLQERSATIFTGEAKRNIHQMIGDDFYQVVNITKSGLEEFYGTDGDTPIDRILEEGTKVTGATVVKIKP